MNEGKALKFESMDFFFFVVVLCVCSLDVSCSGVGKGTCSADRVVLGSTFPQGRISVGV